MTGSSEKIPLIGLLLLLALCLIWGANLVSITFSNQGFPPIFAASVRSIIASISLAIYCAIRGIPFFLTGSDGIHGAILGTIFGIEFLMLYYGTELTTISRTVIFIYTQPFWTALGAHFFLHERLNAVKFSGLTISFLGIVLVFSSKTKLPMPHLFWGDLLELGTGILWAVTIVYMKRFMVKPQISHYQTLFMQLVFSIPALIIGWLLFELHRPMNPTLSAVAALGYQTIVVAFISYLLWFRLIHRYQVTKLASFTFLTPLLGVLLSVIILGEDLTLELSMGLGAVALGIYLVNRPSRGA